MRFFSDIATAYRAGEITQQDIEDWAGLVYPPGEWVLSKFFREDGSLIQFKVVALHHMARDKQSSAPPPAEIPLPAEFLRDVPEPVYENPLPDLAGEIKKKLGIIACVRKFGKPQERISERTIEGVMVRCPFNDHTDNRPSAWVNTSKNVWHCGKCLAGGDVIDFYAARHGKNLKSYQTDGTFHDLVKEMGQELGLSTKKGRGGVWEIVEDGGDWPSPLPDRSEVIEEPPPRDVAVAVEDDGEARLTPPEVIPLVPESREATEPVVTSLDEVYRGLAYDAADVLEEAEQDNSKIPSLNWRDLPINPNTFLGQWMKYAEEFYPWIPEEYFLFTGLQAIGLATGHYTQSYTGSRLTGSLMLALIGPSGGGKSTAVSELHAMFNRVPIVSFNRDLGTGIKVIPSPGSPEALVKSIYTEVEDSASSTPGILHEVPVTAWLHEDEFATLIEKSRRRGGGAMKTRLIQLYDFTKKDPALKELVIDDYSMSGGRRVLHDSYFSAVFTTQTDAVRSMMESSDLISGFLNRIIPVMGPQKVRRRVAGALMPPVDPVHDESYERLWRAQRAAWRVVPFTPEALELVDCHPFLNHVENLANSDSMYSRVEHMTLRLAFLLAVNNMEDEVDVRYVEAACGIGSSYLMNCFGHLRQAVIANDFDECASKIEGYVTRYFDRNGRWPNPREWSKDRSYSGYSSSVRKQALEVLFSESRLVKVRLSEGKAVENVFLVPTGHWANYSDSHDKKFIKSEFYA